jgi:thiosulfate/3-mercaptopyruvate sulfurtransferase
MTFDTLISADEAAAHLADPGWVFVDCRFVLGQAEQGRAAYLDRHIAGAVYAHLDEDLSGPVIPGKTGRHPLPAEEDFEATVARLGIDPESQVVAYDERSGDMAAARLWWLLKWAGHDSVAVLSGGFSAWTALDLPCASGVEEHPPSRFVGRFREAMAASTEEVLASLGDRVLIDSRASNRYRGENEVIDPVAGHIPGAYSLPVAGNVSPDGTFLDAGPLRARFEAVPGADDPHATIFYCGSGVTAAHGVLAYAHAGLGPGLPKLYAGSWSEWITDPARPVETGERPE